MRRAVILTATAAGAGIKVEQLLTGKFLKARDTEGFGGFKIRNLAKNPWRPVFSARKY